MNPVARQRGTGMRAAALRDLILMVGKDEIEPAAMNVDRFAKVGPDHRRAFDVPAGAPAAPRGIPADHPFRTGLPKYEIGWVALIGSNLDASPGDHLFAVAPAEHSIVRIAGDREQHMARRLIG